LPSSLFSRSPSARASIADDESSIDQAATGELGLHGAPEHLFHDRGNARPHGGGGSVLLIDHGGPCS
jgi:hypothetical protein